MFCCVQQLALEGQLITTAALIQDFPFVAATNDAFACLVRVSVCQSSGMSGYRGIWSDSRSLEHKHPKHRYVQFQLFIFV